MKDRLFEQTFFGENEIIYSLPEEFSSLNTANGDLIIEIKGDKEELITIDSESITEFRTTSGEIFDQLVLTNPRGTDEMLKIVEILIDKSALEKNIFYRNKELKKEQSYEKIECYFLKEGSSMAYKNSFFIVNFLHKR